MPAASGPARPRSRLSRRELVLAGGQAVLIGGLVYRANDLQLRRSPEFREVAEDNAVRTELLAPVRSDILDQAGRTLANNRPVHSVLLEVDPGTDPAPALMRLAEIAPLPPETRRMALRLLEEPAPPQRIMLIRHADPDTVDAVAANAPSLPGIVVRQRQLRNYPLGTPLAHSVGYVGRIAAADVTRQPELARLVHHPDYRVGRRGVEARRNADLAGVPGVRVWEVNARGMPQRELRRRDPRRGGSLRLTLDAELQTYAAARLAGESGAAVVMDVASGELRCLLSTPGFDPNEFADGVSTEYWARIHDHPDRPLVDRVLASGYPPGSTFKPVVALAALETGARLPATGTFCSGRQELGDQVFHCWKRGGHGTVALREAIQQSCDVYFYNAGDAVGMEAVADMAARLGLGIAHDIETGTPHSGLIPTPAWKAARRDRRWTRGDMYNAAIGQGFVLTTPLQLAVMTARIANGRHRVAPRLVVAPAGPAPEPLGIDPEHLATVRDGMFAVCNERQGTAWAARIRDPALTLAGKTGTAQVRRIRRDSAGRAVGGDDLPRALRHHALFIGYAPAAAPRLAVAVIVEHGSSGARAAAPVARDLLLHALTGRPPAATRAAATGGASRPGASA